MVTVLISAVMSADSTSELELDRERGRSLTEQVFGDEMSLRYSLLWVGSVAHVAAALLLWRGLRSYEKSINYLEDWTDAEV